MRILTAGDSHFYHCLIGLSESVRKHYGQPLIIYDIGLTEQQKQTLDAEIVTIDIQVDYNNYVSYKDTDFIKTTHKPFCIKHYFENHSEPLIYADADCLFLDRVELDGFDVGVTAKPRKKMDLTNYYNGILNAGVIFFNQYPESLIDRWIKGCLQPDVTDQMVLAKLLSETIDWKRYNEVYDWYGYRIVVLKIEEYNDYYLKTGKILHLKGDFHRQELYEKILAVLDNGGSLSKIYNTTKKKKKTIPARALSAWKYLFSP